MSIRYLDFSGAVNFWTNIKNYILSKVPTKTSELTNDSGFLTQHQSLSNYVTLNSEQTITGKKLFTNATTKVNSVNTFTGSTQFIDLSTTVPRGSFPESGHRVGRVYIGDNTSYNGAWFIIDPTIDTDKAYYRMVTTSPDNTDSTRFSITWDSTKEGARRRRLACMGDLICATNNTYQIGESGNVWKDAYINNVHGISDYTNFLVKVLNFTTTLTHAVSGRRTVVCEGDITLTLPAPEEGSWFHIKATTGSVLLNFANGVSVSGVDGIPITLKPGESILLCYYTASSYVAFCNFKRHGVIGRTGTAPSEPKNWFKVAECTLTETYIDPFICLRIFTNTTGNTIGTLCAHCRINNTIGVVDTSNCYLQWQDAGSGIDLSAYALTTNETSGTGVTITIWCMLVGGSQSLKFEVVTECKRNDYPNDNTWKITRDRQADGDLAELSDTDFTKIVYSTLTTLKNDTIGNAKNVTGTVAIANGGTGATTRLSAVKALTNESVGTPTHFLTITTNYAKAGYTNVAQAKTVLGITGDMGSHSDSEYVHKTGNETISGDKTFSNRPIVYNASASSQSDVPYIWLKNGFIERGSTTNVGEQGIKFVDKNANNISSIVSKNNTSSGGTVLGCTDLELTAYNSDGTNTKTTGIVIRRGASDSKVFPYADDTTDLGTTDRRWSKVYAVNYYYGSNNTEFSTKFVTSDTAQTISGAKTFSSTITGDLTGNASTATEFSTNKDVTLTGDVTGTVSSKAGWSVSTTLSNSGVTAGTYGPSEDVTGTNNTTILVPEITVDAKGRVTSVTNRTYKSVNSDSDKKVYQYYKSDDNVYRLLFSNNAGNTATSNVGAVYSGLNNSFYVNPSTGALYATKLYSNGTEVLTSHQSLSSCVKNVVTNNQIIKSTGITRGTSPSSAQTFGIAFSDNNDKYIGNVYGQYATDKATYVGLYAYKGTTTANGDNASVRVGYDASGNAYTYAPTPATADNSTQIATTAFVKAQGYLTSHQSLANYVTTNTDQSISGIKSHSKHISILGDYIGNESSTNGRSCLYLKANRDTDGKSGLYVTKFRQNVAQGSMGSSDVVFLSHDILENETRTNAGFVESFSNWEDDVPKGMSVYSSIATRNLGTSAKPWTNAYITNLNLNGHVFDPISTSGNIGDIVFAYADAVSIDLSSRTTSGSNLKLLYIDHGESVIGEASSLLSGTWKFLGLTPSYVSTAGTHVGGVWKRIA